VSVLATANPAIVARSNLFRRHPEVAADNGIAATAEPIA
jgi:hypothetical protein